MIEGIEAVGFDLDGTLYKSTDEMNDSVRILMAEELLRHNPLLSDVETARDFFEERYAVLESGKGVLREAGILENRCVTSHPSVQTDMRGISYQDERVVVDGHIVTSKSPGTAMEFSLKLVEILFGEERRDIVNKGVLAKL